MEHTPNIRRVTLQQKLTMKAMYDEGYTLQAIANQVGKSVSTVKRHVYVDEVALALEAAKFDAIARRTMMVGAGKKAAQAYLKNNNIEAPSFGNTHTGPDAHVSKVKEWQGKMKQTPQYIERQRLIARATDALNNGKWVKALRYLQRAEKCKYNPNK